MERANISVEKTVDTRQHNVKLRLTDGEPLADPTSYRYLVGHLVYLCITRLGVSHVVGNVS